jgi:prophage antirepressor-like protein
MGNELEVINEQVVLGKEFKIYGSFEAPLFKADDVAKWIEHSNVSAMLNNIDNDEKVLRQVIGVDSNSTLSNAYSAWFLTEDGIYEVLMMSRKPIAKEFKKQVKEISQKEQENIINLALELRQKCK